MTMVPSTGNPALSLGGPGSGNPAAQSSVEVEIAPQNPSYAPFVATVSMDDVAVRTLGGVPGPGTGPFPFANFYGKTLFVPGTTTYTNVSAGPGTFTIPPGTTTLTIEIWGGGGGGGAGAPAIPGSGGGGGGAGGYVKSVYTIAAPNYGQNISYAVGNWGLKAIATNSPGGTGGSSTASSPAAPGFFATPFTMTAGGGQGGTFGQPAIPGASGSGGSASGSNLTPAVNTPGVSGTGGAPSNTPGTGGSATAGTYYPGTGAGGNGGSNGVTLVTSGTTGAVVFHYA